MTDAEPFDLARFRGAQDPVFNAALAELREGRKRTHWMWFVFPQLRGLGRSPIAHHFGIVSLGEARAYLADAVLGARLRRATEAVLAVEGRSAHDIFGSPDDLKFGSSMTLFNAAADASGTPFAHSIDRYFGGRKDDATLALLGVKSA